MARHPHALLRSVVAGVGVLLYLLAAALIWAWLLLWALWTGARALLRGEEA